MRAAIRFYLTCTRAYVKLTLSPVETRSGTTTYRQVGPLPFYYKGIDMQILEHVFGLLLLLLSLVMIPGALLFCLALALSPIAILIVALDAFLRRRK